MLPGTFWCVYSGGVIEGVVGAVHQRVLAEHGHLALGRLPLAKLAPRLMDAICVWTVIDRLGFRWAAFVGVGK